MRADYRTTVNKFIKDVRYPFPSVEELFAAVQGGETFFKLDFINAYDQIIKLDDSTSKLFLVRSTRGKRTRFCNRYFPKGSRKDF